MNDLLKYYDNAMSSIVPAGTNPCLDCWLRWDAPAYKLKQIEELLDRFEFKEQVYAKLGIRFEYGKGSEANIGWAGRCVMVSDLRAAVAELISTSKVSAEDLEDEDEDLYNSIHADDFD